MISFKTVITSFACVATLVCSFSSCKHVDTYADHLEDEKDEINKFITEEKAVIFDKMPTQNTEWLTADGRPVYYRFSDGLYFHLIDRGDTTTLAPNVGNNVYVRYVGVCRGGGDTGVSGWIRSNFYKKVLYDWSEHNSITPTSFRVVASPNSNYTYGEGFQKAVRCLYAGGHCKVIIPFKIGNGYNNNVYGGVSSDELDYRPMVYEIWVTRVE